MANITEYMAEILISLAMVGPTFDVLNTSVLFPENLSRPA